MAKRYKVNEGTQVDVGGKMYRGGETFTATDAELDEFGSRDYVSEVGSKPGPKPGSKRVARQQAQPTAANKAVAAPTPRETTADKKG